MPKALFLDRDGVINEEVGWLHRAADVRFVAGIFPLCRTARALGYHLVVVTNQAGIGRGYYTEDDFQTLSTWMRAEFEKEGITLDAIFHCPYHPEHGLGIYKQDHEDRKPGPGMLLKAARQFDLDLTQSVMIGDRCTDIAAAHAANLRHAFLIAGTEANCPGQYQEITSLAEAETWLKTH